MTTPRSRHKALPKKFVLNPGGNDGSAHLQRRVSDADTRILERNSWATCLEKERRFKGEIRANLLSSQTREITEIGPLPGYIHQSMYNVMNSQCLNDYHPSPHPPLPSLVAA